MKRRNQTLRACRDLQRIRIVRVLTLISCLALGGCAQWLTRGLPENYEAHGIAWFGSVAYAVTQLPGTKELSGREINPVIMAVGNCASFEILVARTGLEDYVALKDNLQKRKHRLEAFLADACSLLLAAEALSGKVAMEAVVVARQAHVRKAEIIGHSGRMRFYFSEEVANATRSDRFDEMLATMAHEAFHLSLGEDRKGLSPTEQETIGYLIGACASGFRPTAATWPETRPSDSARELSISEQLDRALADATLDSETGGARAYYLWQLELESLEPTSQLGSCLSLVNRLATASDALDQEPD